MKKIPAPRAQVDPRRAQALDCALVASRLLDEKYFADVSDALKNNKPEVFRKICMTAEIPEDMIEPIWKGLLASMRAARMIPPW